MTIFTLGVLLWSETRPRWFVVLVPVLWAFFGSSAAVMFAVKEDAGLFLAAWLLLGLRGMKQLWPAAQPAGA